MTITFADVIAVVGGLASLCAVVVALQGIKNDRKEAIKEAKENAQAEATARAEANATQKQILEEQKKLNKAFEKHLECYGELRIDVTRIEARAEEAHNRIDRLEGRTNDSL